MEFYGFNVDFWTLWGLAAQALFFGSFVVQWLKSEKKGSSYLPLEFWYMRLTGSVMLLAYVVERKDLVFLITIVLQVVIYLRNIILTRRNQIK